MVCEFYLNFLHRKHTTNTVTHLVFLDCLEVTLYPFDSSSSFLLTAVIVQIPALFNQSPTDGHLAAPTLPLQTMCNH